MSWVDDLAKLLDEGGFQVTITGWKAELIQAETENKKLRKALEFYAEPDTYCMHDDLSEEEWKSNWIAERVPGRLRPVGSTARDALADSERE